MQRLAHVLVLGLALVSAACAAESQPSSRSNPSSAVAPLQSETFLFRCALSTWKNDADVTFGSIIASNTGHPPVETLGLEPVVMGPETPTAMIYFLNKSGETNAIMQIRVAGEIVGEASFNDVAHATEAMDVHYDVDGVTQGELTCFKMRKL